MNRDLWLLYHPADCGLGYSTARLRTLLGEHWPSFERFMDTRTLTSERLPTGKVVAVAYTDDVFRFLTTLPAALPSPLASPSPSPISVANGTRAGTASPSTERASAHARVGDERTSREHDGIAGDEEDAEMTTPRRRLVQLTDVVPILATVAAAMLLGRAILRMLGL